MATRIGLEPTTPSVTGWCSNQLSYRAMIAQVRAASYRGNVLYYIGKSVCCQAQICGKCNFLQKRVKTPSVCSLWSQPPSPRGRLNSLSQNLTVLPAPSGREPLARPEALWFDRKAFTCLQRAGTLRWARGREGCSDSPLPTSGLHPPRNGPRAARP